MVTDIGPSTVETVAVRDSVRYAFQRKGFYARGYHWAFYYASGEIYWRRSTDGITWGSATSITPSGETLTDGAEIAVWLDRHESVHHVHIAYADHDTVCPIYYRRGTIDGNGDLTWDSVWQSAVAQEGVSYSNITVCIDDVNGFAFIGYTTIVRAAPINDAKPRVTHSRQTDGTWSTYAGFPKILNATLDTSWVTLVIPSDLDTIIALYARNTNSIFCDVYDVSLNTWVGQIDTGETIGPDATKISATSQRAGKNATLDPKRVHVAYCDGSEDLQHIQIQAGAITGPHPIYTSSIAMSPSISTRIYGGDVNNYRTLYVFWTPITDAPTADWVCYKKSLDAGVTWTKEDGSPGVELWREETVAGLSGVNIASSYFEEQHHATLPESYLGILYTNEGASPDYVRWAGLEFADPDEELLGNAVIRNIGSAELLGKFDVGQNSADLLGKFEAQAIAELLGKAVIRHSGSAELLGNAVIRLSDSAELLGNAEIQQSGSAELLSKAEVQQSGSAELLGRAEIQWSGSTELLGKAVIRHSGSAELLGNAVIRLSDSAELLGNAEIQQSGSAELLGKVEVQQSGSAELLGRFEAQATAELLGKAEVQQSGSAELLSKAEVQQSGSAELLGRAAIRHPGSAELLGNAVIRHSASAELLSKAEVQQSGSAELLGRAAIRHPGSAELLGNAVIRHSASAELLGEAVIRNIGSAELLGNFDVGQNSADLLGKFDVGQNSQNLLGNAVIRHSASAEFLGEAVIRNIGSAELLGGAVIRNIGSAELLGEAVIRHSASAELLGEAVIRNIGSAELLGEAVIRHSASVELLGRFRLSTDDWLIQGVSVEAYLFLRVVV